MDTVNWIIQYLAILIFEFVLIENLNSIAYKPQTVYFSLI